MGNQIGNTNKKSTTTKDVKTEEKHENILEQRRNETQLELKIQLEEIYQKVLAKEGRLKRY